MSLVDAAQGYVPPVPTDGRPDAFKQTGWFLWRLSGFEVTDTKKKDGNKNLTFSAQLIDEGNPDDGKVVNMYTLITGVNKSGKNKGKPKSRIMFDILIAAGALQPAKVSAWAKKFDGKWDMIAKYFNDKVGKTDGPLVPALMTAKEGALTDGRSVVNFSLIQYVTEKLYDTECKDTVPEFGRRKLADNLQRIIDGDAQPASTPSGYDTKADVGEDAASEVGGEDDEDDDF